MYKCILFFLFLLGSSNCVFSNINNEKPNGNIVSAACNPIISIGSIPSGPFCAGNTFAVPFTFTDCVDAGNVFTVQLSNAIGLFTSPVTIGSLSSVNAGSIIVTIPVNTSFGNGYRIRILSSAPNATSADNGFNITINPSPTSNFNINNSTQCLNGNSFNFQNTSTGTISSNVWSFGDGATSIGTNAFRVYTTVGVYNVKLVTTGTNGCRDSITKQVTVYPKPNVAFTTSANCANTSIIQSNNSSIASGTVSYFWDFGDGTTSTQVLPNKVYSIAGTYPIKLVATSDNGCKDSITQNVTIGVKPTASFTINNASQCLTGNSFSFTNTSSGTFISQVWSLGNGVTSNSFNISNYTYPTNGVFQVKLLLIGANGCNDSVIQNVTVSPVPNFSINNASQCLTGNSFSFTNTSVGNIANSFWSFGDGNTAITNNATHSFNAIGIYNVKLKVTEVGGCTDSITKVVQVIEKPNVGFSTSTVNFCAGTTIQFNNASSVSNGLLSYVWSFGDGTTSTNTNPSKVFLTAGTYPVKLVVTNNNGCKDSITQNINILAKPAASFVVNNASQCINGNQFNFTNNSTGVINNFSWSFGDGNTSTIFNPAYTYNSSGNYNVKLYAFGNNGCIDSLVQSVAVQPKPNVSFIYSNSCLNTPIGLVNNSSISNGTVSYFWDFGDGTTSNNLNPLKSYTTAGNYTIKLVGTSNNGCKDSATQVINILPKPTAQFTVNNSGQCISGNNFSFTNNSLNATTQQWFFGDGNTATSLNATHNYSVAGTYNVKLVITGANGCKDSIIQAVFVYANPVASFIPNSTVQCLVGNDFIFSDNTIGNISNYSWSFGDGTISSLQNPTKSYASIGNYSVKLVVTSTNGCKDSISQNVQVVAQPTPAFAVNNVSQCVNGNLFAFTNNSVNASNYEWYFGDGSISSSVNPLHTYGSSGNYTVKLIATSANGCRDSITQTVQVINKPSASFNINALNQCLNGNNFVFNNTTTNNVTGTYLWSFGDGSTSTATNPTKTFAAVGTYNVKLVATNGSFCKDSITATVNVLPKPTASFTINNTTQCAGSNFIFSNTSVGATSRVWSFGEGTTSFSNNPSFVYSIGGVYTVKLVTTGANGCTDSATQVVTVLPRPSAIFGINNLSQCIAGNNFITTNLSTGNVASYNWSFGDGNTSTLTNPTYTYGAVGSYNIKLVATGTNGCKDSLIQPITVVNKPNVAFTVNNAVQCVTNNNFIFNNTTTGATTYSWSFGDATTSTALNPTKVYAIPNSYTVKLVATGNNGCRDSLTQNVSVVSKPIPSFSVNTATQCLSNNNFVFTNASLGGTNFSWSFGDGSTSTSTNPTKSFLLPGTYLVKLLVSNATGCVDSVSQSITIHPKPITDFTISGGDSCLSTPTVSFINASTGATSYNWDFGDGSTNTVQTPTKTFSSFGTYNVKLVSTNSFGCKDSIIKPITIGAKPQASFGLSSTTVCVGSIVSFSNTSTGSLTNTIWDFGDGTTSISPNPSKIYLTAGNYSVKLKVTGANGCTDSITQTIVVTPKPTPSFSVNGGGNCISSTSITLNNTSTNATSYVWSFGDGNTSTQSNPTHTYATQGTYTIKLVATNANGCKDSISQNVTIATKPVASYTLNATTQCASGSPFVFTNTSVGNISSYYWEFGDGIFSTVANPTKVYAVGGTYNVKLVVTGINGCKDSITQTVTVASKPVANFAIVGGAACTNSTSITLNNTTTNATSYVWSFGDGNTSTQSNPTQTYATQGTYTIKLVATNANGCKDSISQNVTIATKPIASYTLNATTQCASGSPFVFTNTSVGNISSYYWEFGDGIFSTVANPTKVYAVGGTYNVKLVVTGINGCKDSITQTVTVASKPVANFAIVGGAACTNSTSITLNNTTTNATSYVWSFGDGNTSTQSNPTQTYATQGTYTIKLVATNANGCKDSISQNVTIATKPIASYTLNATTQCASGSPFVFTNTSVGNISSYYWEFGDGIFSTVANPTKVYAVGGTYNVKLVVTGINGCKDSITQTVTVASKPVTNFTIVGGAACTNSTSIALNNTTTNATSYVWSFGDGTSSILTNPTKNYSSLGTYEIKLVATNANGCIDSFSRVITLSSKPIPSYTVSSTSVCVGNPVIFNNTSSILGTGYHYWDFGNGIISTDSNTTVTYTTPGTYIVKYFLTNSSNCKDSLFTTINVLAKPNVFYRVLGGGFDCVSNLTFIFDNRSGTANNIWTFSDGTSSTTFSPTKTFSNYGTYTVKLVAWNNIGCVDSFSSTFTITPKPIASFNVNNVSQCTDGNRFVFTNNSTVSSVGITAYYWTFGDGTVSQDVNPIKTYLSPGTYPVTLFVTNANGCKDSTTRTLTVLPKPLVSFTFPNNACSSNNTVSFTNTTTGGVSYVWNFGDGTTSTVLNPTKTYAVAGSYIVKLVATNSNGCIDSVAQTITLSSKPIASFNVNNVSQCTDGNRFVFTNNSTVSSVGITAYYWTFGDGTVSQDVNPIKTYLSPGTYPVTLFVTNANGCKDSTTRTLTVLPKPLVSFTFPNNACSSNNTVSFTNTTTGGVSYVWNFGDGTTSTVLNPTKTYAVAGSYIVKLVATNSNGCIDSVAQTITISSKPIASFNINSINGSCAGVSVFNMLNTSSKLESPSYFWEFGNGATSNLQNPSVTYVTPGLYKVKLTVTNTNGCVDTAIQFITVQAKPVAAFSTTNALCTNNGFVNFTNTSTGAVAYLWKFDDGTVSTITNAAKFYPTYGSFRVKLLATNSAGCTDSVEQVINVIEKPIASFNVSNSGGSCAGTTVFTMLNTSTRLNAPTYLWQFGNGATSNLQNPSVTYANAGLYTVRLSVTNANGCVDTAIQFINVTPKPTVAFTINNSNQCLNNNRFVFTPTASNPPIANYTWSFGEGTISTVSNPTKTYSAINSYTVKLIGVSATGCVDSAIQLVSVNPAVQANFNASVDLCSSAVSFTNLSTGTSNGFPFVWFFGDGTTSQVANPVKQYANAGTYNIKLVASNRFCSDSIVKQVFVPQRLSAQFTVNSTTQCLRGNIFNFNVTNPIAANQYVWDFGDTTFSTLQNVSKVYTRPGTYNVKLRVTNPNGCVDSAVIPVQVNGTVTPSFLYPSNYICAGNNIQFVNTTNSTVGVTYLWSFGDGTFSNDVSPFKSFTSGGIYTVKLVSLTTFGCRDSAFVNVLVNEPPKPVISVGLLNRCSNVFSFTNTTTSVAPLTYNWDFGDGTTSNLANLQKAYTSSSGGVVNVVLTVTDTFGCAAVATTPVTLVQRPTLSFTVNTTQQCINGNSFVLSNNSSGITTGTTLVWNFGDGTTSTNLNPTKVYALPGVYNIRLIARLLNGCNDTVTTTVRVNPLPAARISGISTVCSGSITNIGVKFAGTPPYNITYTDGTTNFAINNILVDSITIPVRPLSSSTYRIIQMSDGGSCPISLAQVTGTAIITVIPAPIITRQPVDTGACLGGSTRLYVNVSSATPVTYQWLKNGIEIPGATFSQLTFSNLQPSDVANYSVKVISATCGEILSNTVSVVIGIAPSAPIVTNRMVCFNSTPSPLTATGSNLIWYNTAIGGLGSNVAPIPTTTIKGNQNYFVTSSNNFCESVRVPLTVTVIDSPKVLLSVTPSTRLLPGQAATITATISPSTLVPTNYFWSKNGVNVALGTNTLTVPFAETGTYRVNAVIPSACNVLSDSVVISQNLALAQAVAQRRIFIVPNPVRDVAALYFNAPVNEVITVRLIDELGRIRSTQTLNYLSAFQKVDLNVRNLVPGYYAVEVLNSKGVSIARDILFKYSR